MPISAYFCNRNPKIFAHLPKADMMGEAKVDEVPNLTMPSLVPDDGAEINLMLCHVLLKASQTKITFESV